MTEAELLKKKQKNFRAVGYALFAVAMGLLIARILSNLLYGYLDGKINVAVITQDMMREAGATEDDCDDLASLAGKVKGNVVSITVREIAEGRAKASVRSNRSVDSSAICARLGGGGHFMAAGCTADMGPFELAAKLVEYTIESMT